ncbi:glycoside hydrolase [Bifidobacterium tissieri]|uniref:galactosylceramidase n=1 Tax=Bifidobacterium tissieri TaxID=1630162 RepID=A0A261FDW3_9BIFI|nr:family 16 glycoside hydrolase [Bifidobacterium tissieri]OZG57360.1 glycoside hydrolase [Bifidobacterium tissieri]
MSNKPKRFSSPKKLAVAIASVAMFAPFVAVGTASAAPTDPVEVTVNGSDVAAAAKNRNGLTFKGFGVLSANSTSALLMDYKAQNPEAYWNLINTLFGGDNPIMNTVKIEMGNDRNTSTGPNAATMRSSDEYPNVAREPGFQLAADAMKVNPNVKVSILRWRSPAWVKSNDDVYKWYKNTILAVYRQYGYMVDSVNPHINESGPNFAWTKDFANRVKTDEVGFIGAGTTKDLDGNDVLAWSSDAEKEAFHKIRTIISDEVGTGSFGDDMINDEALRNAVDIAGYHYNTADQGSNFKTLADKYDKEIWNSEAQSTFSVGADRPNNTMNLDSGEGNGTNNGKYDGSSGTGIGGINSPLEMANTFVKGFTQSRRTNFVYQPAIGSFYDGFQYSSKELVSARDPWSGWLYYDTGMSVLEHVSGFAKTGYESNADDVDADGIWRGIPAASRSDITDGNPPGRGTGSNASRGGATSYMTLAAPDKSAFSTVIVNDSQYTKTYKIKAVDMNVGDTMELWETKGAGTSGSYASNYMKPVAETKADADGYYTFTVAPWSIATATTLDKATKNADGSLTAKDGQGSRVAASKEYTNGADQAVLDTDESGDQNGVTWDNTLYADDYDYSGKTVESYDPKSGKTITEDFLKSRGGDTGATPLYTNDTNGAFEVVKQSDGNYVLRQQLSAGMQDGGWNGGAWNGGDPITTIGDNRWANYKASVDVLFEQDGYAWIGAREQGGTNGGNNVSAAQLRVKSDGTWEFYRFGSKLASGNLSDVEGVNWKAGTGVWNNIAVQVAGNVYTAYVNGVQVTQVTDDKQQATGRIQLGSGYTNVQYDNLKVETLDGYTPYYTDLIDNMHMRSWDDVATPALQYNDKWQHLNGQGMYVYKRSISNSTGKGAQLTYTFTGTGLDINGANNGKAKLNVTVDGKQIAASAATIAAGSMYTTYILRGLPDGEHTVTIETADDNAISVDTVGVVQYTAAGDVDTTALKTAVDSYADLKAEDWSAKSWAIFANNLENAKAALADPVGYGLDVEGMNAIISRLDTARQNLTDGSIAEEVQELGFTGLAVVKTDVANLPTKLAVKDGKETAVTWDSDAKSKLASAADYSKVKLSGVTTDKQVDGSKYKFTIEVEAIPANTTYFIDSGTNGKDSPEYTAVKSAVKGLLNDKVDQTSDGSTWGYDANAIKVKSNTDINDKQNTGLYSDDDDVTYYLPLKAGKYKLTAGFQEWWGQENRESAQAVIAADGTTLATGDNLKLGKANPNLTGTVEFTVPTDQTVKYVVSKVGNAQKPVISWLGVAEVADYGFSTAVVKGTDLPKQISVDGLTFDVKSWDKSAASAVADAADYSRVKVSGVKADDTVFSTEVEVIPDGVQYFIDSGTNGKDSPEYTAVKSAVKGLLNDKVDQTSDGSTWGYNPDGQNTYGSGDINDKSSTGLWAGKGKSTIYYLPLKAGTYDLSAGFHEWWGVSRNMKVVVTAADGTELANGNADLSGDAPDVTSTSTIKVDKDQTVTLTVSGVSADPVISWVAVANHKG